MRLTRAEIGKLLTNRFQSRANLEFKWKLRSREPRWRERKMRFGVRLYVSAVYSCLSHTWQLLSKNNDSPFHLRGEFYNSCSCNCLLYSLSGNFNLMVFATQFTVGFSLACIFWRRAGESWQRVEEVEPHQVLTRGPLSPQPLKQGHLGTFTDI